MRSPPDIQLIFAKLLLTAELTFTRAGTDGVMRQDEEKEEKGGERLVKVKVDGNCSGVLRSFCAVRCCLLLYKRRNALLLASL